MAVLGAFRGRARAFATRLVLIAAIGVQLAGCWPARFTERPAVVGAVVSAVDGTPITGASVAFVRPDWNESPFSVATGHNGAFRIAPIHHWGFNTILGEYFPGYAYLEIDAAGFAPERKDISWPPTGGRPLVVGVIELREPFR